MKRKNPRVLTQKQKKLVPANFPALAKIQSFVKLATKIYTR